LAFTKSEAFEEIKRLVSRYHEAVQRNEADRLKEEEVKQGFILPLFKALNWETENYREVSAEENISKKRVDYGFKLNGITKFYVEVKSFREQLDENYAKQAIQYSYLKSVTWAVLTNFAELRVYNADWKSSITAQKLFLQFSASEFVTKFDQLWLLSRDSVTIAELDELAENYGKKEKKIPVTSVTDQLFLDLIDWRRKLTKEITSSRSNLREVKTDEVMDEAVQRILDRLIFIRVCEDIPIESSYLLSLLRRWEEGGKDKPLYQQLIIIFKEFDVSYNSKLFADHPADRLDISDQCLVGIINGMYDNPEGYPYDFSAIGVEVLGTIYEQYLGYILAKHRRKAKIIESYARRKKMGIYYTPTYVVDYIIRNTVLEFSQQHPNKEPTVLDPACGSGSFLTAAFKGLEDAYKATKFEDKIRLLENSIFGVDLDQKAVEIAQLSLLLKILTQRTLLPYLDPNVKVGNSLTRNQNLLGTGGFDWEEKFPKQMSEKGFDIVVGNPPYIDSEEMEKDQELRRFRKDIVAEGEFEVAKGNWDIFCLFLEKGVNC